MTTLPAIVQDLVIEYVEKNTALEGLFESYNNMLRDVQEGSRVNGVGGHVNFGYVQLSTLRQNLRLSAWEAIVAACDLGNLMTDKDKRMLPEIMEQPVTMSNVEKAFGRFLENKEESLCKKVYSTVRYNIGDSKTMPKKIVVEKVVDGPYKFHGYGFARAQEIMNAIFVYRGQRPMTHNEMHSLVENGEEIFDEHQVCVGYDKYETFPARGVSLKLFGNGNGHIILSEEVQKDFQKALDTYHSLNVAE